MVKHSIKKILDKAAENKNIKAFSKDIKKSTTPKSLEEPSGKSKEFHRKPPGKVWKKSSEKSVTYKDGEYPLDKCLKGLGISVRGEFKSFDE